MFRKVGEAEVSGEVVEVKEIKKDKKREEEEEDTKNIHPPKKDKK